jgi:hypothetical protein
MMPVYDKLLTENITKSYKVNNVNDNILEDIHEELRGICQLEGTYLAGDLVK